MSKSRKNKAVALRYRVEEDAAPVVIASGYGNIAEKIVEIAEQQGIPVFRDDSAASLLCMLEVGKNIPPELYEVIAAIYAQILRVSQQIKSASTPAAATRAAGADTLRERVMAGLVRQKPGGSREEP